MSPLGAPHTLHVPKGTFRAFARALASLRIVSGFTRSVTSGGAAEARKVHEDGNSSPGFVFLLNFYPPGWV